jgi:hypothetical protein
VLDPSSFQVELVIGKLKSHKSPDIDQIPGELMKAVCRTIHNGIHKLIIYIWNKEELPEEWKESIIVSIYKRGDKTECINPLNAELNPICHFLALLGAHHILHVSRIRVNYSGISLLPNKYKILFNILLSRLTPYAEKITGDN